MMTRLHHPRTFETACWVALTAWTVGCGDQSNDAAQNSAAGSVGGTASTASTATTGTSGSTENTTNTSGTPSTSSNTVGSTASTGAGGSGVGSTDDTSSTGMTSLGGASSSTDGNTTMALTTSVGGSSTSSGGGAGMGGMGGTTTDAAGGTGSVGAHPGDAVEFEGHWYRFTLASVGGAEAQALCEDLGGYLACIEDEAEDDFVFTLAGTDRPWIGLNNEDDSNSWVWVDGSPVTYTNWQPGQPDYPSTERWVKIAEDSMWDDGNIPSSYICEWDG